MAFQHDARYVFPRMAQQNLPAGRVYAIVEGPDTGKFYPSITRVLKAQPKPQLDAWKERVGPVQAEVQANRARLRGHSIHSLFELYLKNQPLPTYTPVVGELWMRLRKILDANVGTIYGQEQDVYSNHLMVAGRMDLLGEWDGKLSIIDLKNSKKAKAKDWESVQSYFIQGAFYALAAYERTGARAKQIVLPVVSPEQVQVFIEPVGKYYDPLMKAIELFYQAYEKELDIIRQS